MNKQREKNGVRRFRGVKVQSLLLGTLTASTLLFSCGDLLQDVKKEQAAPASAVSPSPSVAPKLELDFNTHINPVIKSSCGGSICHGAGSAYGVYIDREDLYNAAGPVVLDRLATTDIKKVMPKYGFPIQLKSTDKATLQNYFKERGIVASAAPKGTGTTGPGTSGPPSPTPTPGFTQPPALKLCVAVTPAQKATGLAMTFTQVTSIFTPNCGGAGCHSGVPLPRGFVGQASSLDDQTYSAGIVIDIQNGSMPRGRTMTPADKEAVINYLCARYDF